MVRLTKEHRKRQILTVAYALSQRHGLYKWTLREVASFCACSVATVRYHYTSQLKLREDVIIKAAEQDDFSIIIQAVAMHDPAIDELTAEIVTQAREAIRNAN